MKQSICDVIRENIYISLPFAFSVLDNPSDGRGGPSVSDPLEFRLVSDEDNEEFGIFSFGELLLEYSRGWNEDGEDKVAGKEWAQKTVAALRALANEIESAAFQPSDLV